MWPILVLASSTGWFRGRSRSSPHGSSSHASCHESEFRDSLAVACERGTFRVVHYSLQRDHIHLIVEAHGKQALGSGMKSIAARLARAAHQVFDLRGPVSTVATTCGCSRHRER